MKSEILRILPKKGRGMTINEIAEALGITYVKAYVQIDRLEANGYVYHEGKAKGGGRLYLNAGY